jgi:hypothetical protein
MITHTWNKWLPNSIKPGFLKERLSRDAFQVDEGPILQDTEPYRYVFRLLPYTQLVELLYWNGSNT